MKEKQNHLKLVNAKKNRIFLLKKWKSIGLKAGSIYKNILGGYSFTIYYPLFKKDYAMYKKLTLKQAINRERE